MNSFIRFQLASIRVCHQGCIRDFVSRDQNDTETETETLPAAAETLTETYGKNHRAAQIWISVTTGILGN